MSKNSLYRDYAQNLPFGMVHDDNLEYVREQMYIVLNPDETAAVIGVGVVLRSNSDISTGNNNILDAAAGLLDNDGHNNDNLEEPPAPASTPGGSGTLS
jgi:hypothetical protein